MTDDANQREPAITVSLSRKINLENSLGPKHRYESAEFFVAITGVRAGATPEEIAALLTTGKEAWDQARTRLAEQIANYKKSVLETG